MIVNNIDAELEEFEIAGLTAQEAIAETAARMEVLRTQMHVDSATNGEGNRNILTLALAEGIEGRIVKQSLLAALTENGIRWSEDSTHFTPGVDKPLWLIEGFSPRRPADPFNVEGPKYATSKAKPFPNVIRNAEVNPPHFDAKLAATSAICYHPVSKHPDSIVHPPRRPTTANSSYSSSTVPPRHPLHVTRCRVSPRLPATRHAPFTCTVGLATRHLRRACSHIHFPFHSSITDPRTATYWTGLPKIRDERLVYRRC
ncbi:hypothetical protein R3P38DRAFT_3272052 [Favolaschia claudopus]|uniref:Uncharacterized protein n=1 Tax=Favolaschia claudopus TaxID=2862362 RepID=A0AAW0B5Y6_9AGAR